ncbi:amino acid ABC transporter ATP-binding protein [Cytophagales bacterium WSM2-2]|nr:amino acid ABC transporter ATP-binding protein [Cytophagales bacterium WSM2-2]
MAAYEQKDIILHVENLSIAYGEQVIIKDVNLMERNVTRTDVVQGQIIAVLGRSGRGKSTLFKALTGLVPPTTGRVLIPDYSQQPTNGTQPAKHVTEGDVGFVDQKYTLFRHKTVLDAAMYALRNADLKTQEKHDRVMSYLTDWGLEKVKSQYPNELSGGQKQRVAIIEQLLSSGHYIVLDEPFSGLDVGNIYNVKKAFKLIENSHELNTIIFSTHDIELAAELADSIYVMGYPKKEDGSLTSTGTIIKHFDLKAMGIAWQNEFTSSHLDVVREIKSVMMNS